MDQAAPVGRDNVPLDTLIMEHHAMVTSQAQGQSLI